MRLDVFAQFGILLRSCPPNPNRAVCTLPILPPDFFSPANVWSTVEDHEVRFIGFVGICIGSGLFQALFDDGV